MIRVALVDDQTLIRQGIRSLLELAGGIAIVAEAADGVEAIDMIRRERPDVRGHLLDGAESRREPHAREIELRDAVPRGADLEARGAARVGERHARGGE